MVLQRFYSLILPNPGFQIAHNKYSICRNIAVNLQNNALYSVHWIHKICRVHLQSRENRQCHMFCTGCPYSKIGVVRTVQNSHVTLFCSISLMFRKSGVLRTVNGAACVTHWYTIYNHYSTLLFFNHV